MNIPPKCAKSPDQLAAGKTTGVSAFLRSLQVGEPKDCPQRWESGLGCAAQGLGIKVVSRRLGRADLITVYRVE